MDDIDYAYQLGRTAKRLYEVRQGFPYAAADPGSDQLAEVVDRLDVFSASNTNVGFRVSVSLGENADEARSVAVMWAGALDLNKELR